MKMIDCFLRDNECYSNPNECKKCVPVGIVLHSTGANNTSLKRYVQPSTTDANYDYLIGVLGKNKYNNHWNRKGVYKSAHYFIGKDADGEVSIVYTIPEYFSAWGCGNGSKGSYNYDPTAHIQIECCEDNLTDKRYFENVYNCLVYICSKLCIRYNFDVSKITTHKQAHALGYASNHRDIDHWFSKFNVTLDMFREDVKNMINEEQSYKKFDVVISSSNGEYHVKGEYKKII